MSNYTFRNLESAVRCATGGETIYIHGNVPYYGPVDLSNLHPTRQVLVLPYSGETATLDGQGTIAEGHAIIDLEGSSNIALQDLEITNTGTTATGSFGVDARNGTNLKFYYNTIHEISNNGLMVGGTNIKAVGNLIYRAATEMLDDPGAPGIYLNDGLLTYSHSKHSTVEFSFNDIHDVGGECLGVYAIDGATVMHNKVHDCMNVNIYVSATRNSVIDGNWTYSTGSTPNYNGNRAVGIQLAVEAVDADEGYPLTNVKISNNLIERVYQGIKFWKRCTDPDTPSPGCSKPVPAPSPVLQEQADLLTIAYNDIKYTDANPVKLDQPRVTPTNNVIFANISLHYTTASFIYVANWTGWYEYQDWYAPTASSPQTPGLQDPDGTGYQDAYRLLSDSTLRDKLSPSSYWYPAQDYFCRNRPVNGLLSYGASEN